MAYELPFILSAASVAMAAGTLALSGIVDAWEPWWLLWQLPGAVVFFVAGLAELQRPPFDMPVGRLRDHLRRLHGVLRAEVRVLPAGRVRGDRGGCRRSRACSTSAGYRPLPLLGFIPDPFWMLGKIGFLSFIVIWLRATYPRLREDQLQRGSWLYLIPMSLVLIMVTAVWKIYTR